MLDARRDAGASIDTDKSRFVFKDGNVKIWSFLLESIHRFFKMGGDTSMIKLFFYYFAPGKLTTEIENYISVETAAVDA